MWCRVRVDQALNDKPGVHGVELDFEAAVVTIDYDAADTDVAELEARLRRAGYGPGAVEQLESAP
ncbi:MAG: cation transporter [Planctomycetota bacterium]|nr:cation transporter [Planctomycetota bacterium]